MSVTEILDFQNPDIVGGKLKRSGRANGSRWQERCAEHEHDEGRPGVVRKYPLRASKGKAKVGQKLGKSCHFARKKRSIAHARGRAGGQGAINHGR